MKEELPYTKSILEKLIKKIEEIPLENKEGEFNSGENCFRLKALQMLKEGKFDR